MFARPGRQHSMHCCHSAWLQSCAQAFTETLQTESCFFFHEVFFPDRTDPDAPQHISKLEYCETSKQKGDWMTKENPANKFLACLKLAGYVGECLESSKYFKEHS